MVGTKPMLLLKNIRKNKTIPVFFSKNGEGGGDVENA
jgi:hypothetical protein